MVSGFVGMSWNDTLYRQLHSTARDSPASTKVLERGFVQRQRLELGCFKWSGAASLAKRSLGLVGALLRAAVGTQSELSTRLGSDRAAMDLLLEGAVNRNDPAVRGASASSSTVSAHAGCGGNGATHTLSEASPGRERPSASMWGAAVMQRLER